MYAVNEEALAHWGAVAPKNKSNIYIFVHVLMLALHILLVITLTLNLLAPTTVGARINP